MKYLYSLLALFMVCSIQKTNDRPMVFVEGTEGVDAFYMDQYEVTLAQFNEFVKETNYQTETEKKGEGRIFKGLSKMVPGVNWRHDVEGNLIELSDYSRYPVTRLNVVDIKNYCKWAGLQIPSLEEWLLAANEGSKDLKYKYSGSNNLNRVGWFDGNSRELTQPIGTKNQNALGFFDMSGNVGELVWTIEEKDTVYKYVGGTFFHDKSDAQLSNVVEGFAWEMKEPRFTEAWSSPYLGLRLVRRESK